MSSIKDLKKQWLQDKEFSDAYSSLAVEFAVAKSIIQARTKAHLTQQEIAEKIGTTQSVIARLESGKVTPSVSTLQKIAIATHTKLSINFQR